MALTTLFGNLEQGCIYAILALGLFIAFRILNLPDLTVDGSFVTGLAYSCVWTVAGHPLIGILMGTIGGLLAGVVTGIFHTKLKVHEILAGILTMIGLYSINLRVMGKANLPLLQQETLFTEWNLWGLDTATNILLIGTVVVVLAILLTYWFFGTELGTAIRATGANPHMIRANGVNTDVMIVLGLLLSNGMVAICGALVAQSNGFADVGMGTGTIVIGLASVIIGEVLFGTRSFKNWLISVVLGSVVYRAVIAIVLQLGMPPNDLKLFTAILVAIALSLPLIQSKYHAMKKGAE